MGLDGAGKTTQARRLAEWLSTLGVDAAYRRCEGGRSDLDRLARRLGRADFAELVGRESAGYAQAAIRWRSISAAAALLARPGAFVVMDRYVPCQYAAADVFGLPMSIIRPIFAEFPPPDLALFLEIDPVLASERVDQRGTDSDSVHLLRALDAAYRALPEFDAFAVVDAARGVDEVASDVQRQVLRAYPLLPKAEEA